VEPFVDLAQAGVDAHHRGAALGQEVLPEVAVAVQLHGEAAELVHELLPSAAEIPALASKLACPGAPRFTRLPRQDPHAAECNGARDRSPGGARNETMR
jgi:hypothetical protein